jgi:hypothetical protein
VADEPVDEPLFAPGPAQYIYVQPDTTRVAVLERVDEDRLPVIVSPARTRCLWCSHWCWLGDQSMQLIVSGGASPMCEQCAIRLLPGNALLVDSVIDTMRDGEDGR